MDKPIIYISSTFFDLQEHRRVLTESLRNTNVFDVRGMENYGTISKRPLDACLDDVASSEFYILLLGKRYGFIPEGYNFSITNLEYKKAIGDEDMSRVAGKPERNNRCVLPFISDDNYVLGEDIKKAIGEEEIRDGDALTQTKNKNLTDLKTRIKSDFVIDKSFTSPADLVMKVMGALIPELVNRNYASLVNNILLHEEIVYRCNRVKAREDFLLKNLRLFRVFIIHGERCELPEIFSNNISHYDLNITKQIEIKNLDEYTSTIPEKFLPGLAVTFHQRIFSEWPETDEYSFENLAENIIAHPTFSSAVIRIEISHESWKKFYTLIELFFNQMSKMRSLISLEKNLYVLFNIKYRTPDNILQENPPAAAVLDKLRRINISDIEEWVETYFYMNKDITKRNRNVLLADEIIQYYFKDYAEADESFSMQDAIKRLTKIVNDFNNNANLFENYKKLYSE